jgi:hypothetical protein
LRQPGLNRPCLPFHQTSLCAALNLSRIEVAPQVVVLGDSVGSEDREPASPGIRVMTPALLMPQPGFEPGRPNGHDLLRIACLPIPTQRLVLSEGVEPSILAAHAPKACVYTNSTTTAWPPHRSPWEEYYSIYASAWRIPSPAGATIPSTCKLRSSVLTVKESLLAGKPSVKE